MTRNPPPAARRVDHAGRRLTGVRNFRTLGASTEGSIVMKAVVCGVDPGLGVTGYAVLRIRDQGVPEVLDAGVCRSDPRRALPDRLVALESDIAAVIEEHGPHLVAVEQLYSHYNHPRTSILMGHARGVILLAAAREGIEVRSYSATRIKRHLTGNGRATKAQVQRVIQATLGLAKLPEPADVADAMAIALCCIGDTRGTSNVECGMRKARKRSLPHSAFTIPHSPLP